MQIGNPKKLRENYKLITTLNVIIVLFIVSIITTVFWYLKLTGHTNGGKDFSQWITSTSVQRATSGSNDYIDIDLNNAVVNKNDSLRFRIEYTIPPNSLDSTNTITYKLPDVIKTAKADSGRVIDKTGNYCGNYTISETGLISITFLDEYALNNKNHKDLNGQDISGVDLLGFISFETKVSDIQTEGEQSKPINIGGSTIVLRITEGSPENDDLSIKKSYSITNAAEGTVSFTITVTSKNGTATAPQILDHMAGGIKYLDGLQVLNSSGTDITKNCVINAVPGDENFSLTLPSKLYENETYTIKYNGKYSDIINGSKDFTNRATAIAKNKQDKSITEYSQIKFTITNNLLQKSGKLSSDGTSILWSILINEAKANISEWVLNDIYKDGALPNETQITLSDSKGNSKNITLPYTFPQGSTDVYTLTYSTPFSQDIGTNGVKNTAVLTPNNPHTNNKISSEATVGNGDYLPLTKTADNISVNEKTATITWTVKINADKAEIPAGWIYTDELQNGQSMSETQKNTLKNNIDAAFKAAGIKGYKLEINNHGFVISKTDAIPKNKTIQFTYQSTGTIDDINLVKQFKNKGIIKCGEHKVQTEPKIEYKPVLHKLDAKSPVDEIETKHEYHEINGQIEWFIEFTPTTTTGKTVIYENLPDGLIFKSLTMQIANKSTEESLFKWNENNGTCDINKQIINSIKDNNKIEITLTSENLTYINKNKCLLRLTADIDMNKWPKELTQKNFHNKVLMKHNEELIGKSEQTQQITYNKYENALSKSGSFDKDGQSACYQITINPEGHDLIPNNDRLILEDTLSYYNHASSLATITLNNNSVHLYERNPDGSKGKEIPKEEYSFVYKTERHGNTTICKITADIPDGKPLIFEYRYFTFANNNKIVTVDNKAVLKGISETTPTTTKSITADITYSAAGISANSVILYKVDSSNYGVGLAGAEFDLFKYNSETSKYEKIKTFTTETGGKYTISNIVYNTAYMLIEKNAPENYIIDPTPYYFYLPNSMSSVSSMPSNFNGDALLPGSTLYRPNKSSLISLKVKKNWIDSDGNTINKIGNVEFELYQRAKSAESSTNINFTADIKEKRYGNDFWKKEYQYPLKTTLTFTVMQTNVYRDSKPNLFLNGAPLLPSSEKQIGGTWNNGTWEYTYTIILNENIELSGYIAPQGTEGEVSMKELVFTPPSVNPTGNENDIIYGTYTISSSNNWEKIINKLPSSAKDSQGNEILYEYYIKEKNLPKDCSVTYENNDGIRSGIITMTNTLPKNTQILPKTGGISSYFYKTIGLFLVTTTSFILLKRKYDLTSSH
ncbi:MAG: SpaA isopeptide-forming pilin-related protein [Candidatus Fimenecus sp.]